MTSGGETLGVIFCWELCDNEKDSIIDAGYEWRINIRYATNVPNDKKIVEISVGSMLSIIIKCIKQRFCMPITTPFAR